MADTLSTIKTGAGTQNSTQDPQTAGNSAGAGTPTSSVQPGSVGSLDTATGGVPLGGSRLSTIPLSQTSTSVVKADAGPQHSGLASSGISIVLFLLAAGMLIAIFAPAKNTTK